MRTNEDPKRPEKIKIFHLPSGWISKEVAGSFIRWHVTKCLVLSSIAGSGLLLEGNPAPSFLKLQQWRVKVRIMLPWWKDSSLFFGHGRKWEGETRNEKWRGKKKTCSLFSKSATKTATHAMPCHAVPCHVVECHVVLGHAVTYSVMSCRSNSFREGNLIIYWATEDQSSFWPRILLFSLLTRANQKK